MTTSELAAIVRPFARKKPRPADGTRRLVKLVLAFGAVYLIWGSTYLAIRFGIETMPPLYMIGTRFLLAGTIVFLPTLDRRAMPTLQQWRNALVVGGLLMTGVGLVAVAERTVDSGIAALIVALIPVWVVLLDWVLTRKARPRLLTVTGLAVGMAGVVALVAPGAGTDPVSIPGVVILVLSTQTWALGTVLSRDLVVHEDGRTATGMNMLAGGAVVVLLAIATGEFSHFNPSDVSLASFLAWLYLAIPGGVVVFSAYMWLVKNVDLAKVSTYALVNPIIAVLLGWWLGGEIVGSRTLLAGLLVLAGIVLVNRGGSRPVVPRQGKARPPVLEPCCEACGGD